MAYIGKAPGFGIRNRYYYTATASQTLFSGADDNGGTLKYSDAKYIDVTLNGVELVSGTDYTATTGTSVTLTSGAAVNDVVGIVVYDLFSIADTVSATTGGTFDGTVTFNNATPISGVDIGDLDNVTSSSSAPATNTNPASGVGTVWINTSTGQMYVCKAATTDANIWINVGTGTTNILPSYSVDYLVVAGGGAGGATDRSGGGGAGGLKASYSTDPSGGASSSLTALTFNPGTVYTVTVGAGGTAGSDPGASGSDSSLAGSDITTVSCLGGGGGNYFGVGASGGCGGGGGIYSYAGGSGTTGQGFGGGTADGAGAGNNAGGGGGGGTGAVGGNSSGGGVSGAGGVGTTSTIISTAQATSASVGEVDSSILYFGGGGGGGNFSNFGGDGGLGGGGTGAYNGTTKVGSDGGANTGGGGGGYGGGGGTGGPFDGGSGVVILRMPTVSYSGTTTGSPTVTTDGSDTILIFTSSGTYTA